MASDPRVDGRRSPRAPVFKRSDYTTSNDTPAHGLIRSHERKCRFCRRRIGASHRVAPPPRISSANGCGMRFATKLWQNA